MKKLLESGSVTKAGRKARIRIITAGKGSSGDYPAEVIEQYGPAAWPKGTHIYFDHLTASDNYERNGSHSVKDLVGTITSDPVFVEADGALDADAEFVTQHAEFIEQVMDNVGLSVEAQGDVDESGTVTFIAPSPLNAVAVVPRAGRGGAITELIEGYRDTMSSEGVETHHAKDDTQMKPEDISAIVEGVTKALAGPLDAITEALTPKNDEAETPGVDAIAEALIEADLPKAVRTQVYESVKAGAEPEKAIADFKALGEAFVAAAKETPGRIQESAKDTDDFTIGAWN